MLRVSDTSLFPVPDNISASIVTLHFVNYALTDADSYLTAVSARDEAF